MAQRTTMPMILAQLMTIRDNARPPPSTPDPEPTDTIYNITAHISAAHNSASLYHSPPTPAPQPWPP